MKKYISEYITRLEAFIKNDMEKASDEKLLSMISEFDSMLSRFQHERLIHLLVTILFALMEIMSVIAMMVDGKPAEMILCGMFLILLIPYVMHYYFLENSVQKLYHMGDRMQETLNSRKQPTQRP